MSSLVRRIPLHTLAVVSVLLLVGCLADRLYKGLQPTPIPSQPAPAGLASVSAQTCTPCHADIAAEWAESGMAQSFSDPIFQAEWDHQKNFYYCLSCHAPLEAQQPTRVTGLSKISPPTPVEEVNPLFSAKLQSEGVTCVSCHLKDGAMVGPHEVNAPHPTRMDPTLGEAQTCERCHQMPQIPFTRSDRPLTDTHAEWAQWQEVTGSRETCTDCHMPEVKRRSALGSPVRIGRRHTFPGAWDDELVRQGLGVQDASIEAEGVGLTLVNRAGHRFPSGEPGRALVVKAIYYEEDGTEVGESAHRIERRVVIPSGRELGDNTLLPGEERRIVLPRPSEGHPVRAVILVEFDRLANLEATHHLDVPNRRFNLQRLDLSW